MARVTAQGGRNYVEIFSYTGTTLTSIGVFDHITSVKVTGDPVLETVVLELKHKDYATALITDFYEAYSHKFSTEVVRDEYDDSTYDESSPAQQSAPSFVAIAYVQQFADSKVRVLAGEFVLGSTPPVVETASKTTYERTDQFIVVPSKAAYVLTGKFNTAIVTTETKVLTVGEFGEWLTMEPA